MRVAVRVEDTVYGFEELLTWKQLEQVHQAKNVKGDLLEAWKNDVAQGGEGLKGFDDEFFGSIGGGVASALMQQNKLDASGLNMLKPGGSAPACDRDQTMRKIAEAAGVRLDRSDSSAAGSRAGAGLAPATPGGEVARQGCRRGMTMLWRLRAKQTS